MARKGERDWAQLDAFEAEYAERLTDEQHQHQRQRRSDDRARNRARSAYSPFLDFLGALAGGQEEEIAFFAHEVETSRDDQTRRLVALRGKILSLREKLGVPDEGALLPSEKPFVEEPSSPPGPENTIRFVADTVPPGHHFPVTFGDIKATLAELPPEHAATVREIRLSNQKRTGTDGDWLDGEIRLHCLIPDDGRRLVGRTEGTQDVERFGGKLEWEGTKLYARWPLEKYKIFVLRRVLIHEVAHGVAELPGHLAAVRSAGSIERFCEQYAENFYRPPGPSVKLGF